MDSGGPWDQPTNPFTNHRKSEMSEIKKSLQQTLENQVVSTFSTPHGMQLLDTLDDMYVRQPVAPIGAPEGYHHVREGENRIIRMFRLMVNKANAGTQ